MKNDLESPNKDKFSDIHAYRIPKQNRHRCKRSPDEMA